MKIRQVIFIAASVLCLIGILTYLRVAFNEADIKTAVRLVEEARTGGITLRDRMEPFLPHKHKWCEVREVNHFYGHMEVRCKDIRNSAKILAWRVNVIDGVVQPLSEASVKLGKGEAPW